MSRPEVSLVLPADDTGAGRARRLVRDVLTNWHLLLLLDDAELAVSELVTNAFRHGLPPVVVTLRREPTSVRLDVSDARPATAALDLLIPSQDTDESGRGLAIVEAVSDDCGTEPLAGGAPGKSCYASWDCAPEQPGAG